MGNIDFADDFQKMIRIGIKKVPPIVVPYPATEEMLVRYQRAVQDKIYSKYKRLTKAFREIDEDHSGQISKDELSDALNNYNLNIPTNHVHQLVDRMCDQDGDGMISYDEFSKALKENDMQK